MYLVDITADLNDEDEAAFPTGRAGRPGQRGTNFRGVPQTSSAELRQARACWQQPASCQRR
jgi:hypothetical protein